VDGLDEQVPVRASLVSSVDEGSPILRWHGRLESGNPGALWPAHEAGWAHLLVEGVAADFQITAYDPSGPCEIRGVGTPPF
jgi:hypothetical protein